MALHKKNCLVFIKTFAMALLISSPSISSDITREPSADYVMYEGLSGDFTVLTDDHSTFVCYYSSMRRTHVLTNIEDGLSIY